jgi:hypothetical protein
MMRALPLLLAAAVPAYSLLLGSPTAGPALSSRAVRMQMDKLTVTLIGCESGVGVGLDENNCVDMLAPGKPAEAELQMGDKVLLWNGIEMVDFTGERRMLKDVVVRADVHTLVIERKQNSLAKAAAAAVAKSAAAAAEQAASKQQWTAQESWSGGGGGGGESSTEGEWKPQESWGDTGGSSGGDTGGAPPAIW